MDAALSLSAKASANASDEASDEASEKALSDEASDKLRTISFGVPGTRAGRRAGPCETDVGERYDGTPRERVAAPPSPLQ